MSRAQVVASVSRKARRYVSAGDGSRVLRKASAGYRRRIRSTFVAATMRMLVRCTFDEPGFRNSPLSARAAGVPGEGQLGHLVEEDCA